MVGSRYSKGSILGQRVEVAASHVPVETRQHCREVLQEALSFRRRLVTVRRSNQQIIVKHLAKSMQRPADWKVGQALRRGNRPDFRLTDRYNFGVVSGVS